jgi:thiamine-monophosphate kinase
MIDISDGLAQDLAHICQESAVSAVLEAGAVPLSAGLELVAGDSSILEIGLSSGEEYELLFTAPKRIASDLEALGDSLGIILTPIGEVIPKGDYPLQLSRGGRLESLATKGYDHFAPRPGT